MLNPKVKSIMTDDFEHCYFCGGRATELHHCFHGTARRKKADLYGLTVPLCSDCHRKLHDKGEGDLMLMQEAQRKFEKKYGREMFMRLFLKSWL